MRDPQSSNGYVVPGEWLLAADPIEINAGRRKLRLSVRNTGDRPIQVGSHFPLL
jgi:urease subunit beta/urease subunit gamma/beta